MDVTIFLIDKINTLDGAEMISDHATRWMMIGCLI